MRIIAVIFAALMLVCCSGQRQKTTAEKTEQKGYRFSRVIPPKTCYITKHTYIEKYCYHGEARIEMYYWTRCPEDKSTIVVHPLILSRRDDGYISTNVEAFNLSDVTPWRDYDPVDEVQVI